MPVESQIETLITRRRWDWYFLPPAVLAGVVGVVVAWYTNQWQMALLPVAFLPHWLLFRFLTPKSGRIEHTIRTSLASKIAAALLGFLIIALMSLLLLIDVAVIGHGLREPLSWYHWIGFVGILSVMLFGLWVHRKVFPLPTESGGPVKPPESSA
jgi:hypothetical protein